VTAAAARYAVAAVKPWNLAEFERRRAALPGAWTLITAPGELTAERLAALSPRYVFFPHWSWRVPDEILGGWECVCFHMTDVPYGRGGSPLQNLILRGHRDTVLTALRMTAELDAGPVYARRPLPLSGRAQDIYERAAALAFDMMAEIARDRPEPAPQRGEPVVFRRRTPEMSELPREGSAEAVHDFVRMLDADTYPRAFLDWGGFRLEFSDARLAGGAVEARVRIAPKGGG